MAYKINISQDGKSYQLETDVPSLEGRKIGDKIEGEAIKSDLNGYELEITGTSDSAGFPGKKDEEGRGLRKVLLKKGFGMKTRQRKEGEGKERQMPKGFKQKKTVRGNTISEAVVQVNCNVIEEGSKKLEKVFGGEDESEGEKEEGEGGENKGKKESNKEDKNKEDKENKNGTE